VALSNRWLPVPIAEAAVSAAVSGAIGEVRRCRCHRRVAYECRGAEPGAAEAGRWAAPAASSASIPSALRQG